MFCAIIPSMTKTRITLDLDSEADSRLRMLAELRGQETSRVVSDALALLDSLQTDDPDIEEDIRRLQAFERTQQGVPLDEVKAWVRSWGTVGELSPPTPRKLG
jgi:predicted transcriptional regulator